MADNVRITEAANSTPPDGTVIATDDVAGVQYQVMKLATGGDGVATLVNSVTGLPVSLNYTSSTGQLDTVNALLTEVINQIKVTNLILNQINNSNIDTGDIE